MGSFYGCQEARRTLLGVGGRGCWRGGTGEQVYTASLSFIGELSTHLLTRGMGVSCQVCSDYQQPVSESWPWGLPQVPPVSGAWVSEPALPLAHCVSSCMSHCLRFLTCSIGGGPGDVHSPPKACSAPWQDFPAFRT